MRIPRCTWLAATLLLLSASAFAEEDINTVIREVRAPSYDCPDDTLLPKLEAALTREALTASQRFALLAAKGQFLICQGDYTPALELLTKLIEQDDADTSSYAYVSAINQIGFIYDAQENPARCSYYQQAQKLSSPSRHSDIFMSSSLGLITYCSADDDVSERLGKMFSILERYSGSGLPGELAHIHNSIGLLYGSLGQHALAAEQFLKAHEMGLKVYESSNKLSILISAIVSLLGSGQTDEAYRRIEEYRIINAEVDTPLTNYYYYYSLSFFYRKTRNFEQLAESLPAFKQSVDALSSPFATMIYDWHEAEVCLYHNDIPCIKQYISHFEKGINYIPPRFRTNLDYLSFNLAMYLALGDIEGARVANEKFAIEAENKRIQQQDSARVLSAANLYTRIYGLESEIERAELARERMLYAVILLFIVSSAIAAFFLRRKFMAAKAIDPVTQVLNAEVAINRINKLNAPESGRAIGIAIFDINNLREYTRQYGSSKTDIVLRKIATTMQNNTRGNDILGRFGNEQFILCLHNVEERSARPIFEKVQSTVNSTLEDDVKTGNIMVKADMTVFIAHEKINGLSDILDEMVMSIGINSNQ